MTQAYAESSDGFDTWTAMEAITQETRASVIADIVGHPKGMPSMTELDYVNPSINRSSLSGHLEVLQNAGVVGRAEIPVGERSRDLPYVFYYITDDARSFFDRNDLFDTATWREQYAKVQKTPEMKRVEEMDRPEKH